MDEPNLHETLRRHWGYETFRPRQEEIVRAMLAGHDVAAVLPTGGGKSLCYQMAASIRGGTTVVISPLIALMQDQVQQLDELGIPAALLNSSVDPFEQGFITREARRGAFRLLYIAPERLAREDTLDWLAELDLAFFVIDEAHCISEWGHEFRPEYRQLLSLRERFPNVPAAAFTASATRRVRLDVLEQLGLRQPKTFITSFHRPNLRYVVRECTSKNHVSMLRRVLAAHRDESVIVYASTIKLVEEVAAGLAREGVLAVTYHGKMDTTTRRRNQELWMSDQARVLVGTLAFGMGINKAAVRAVIHLSLPKSIEQYYQESGRAGRDGEPADCVLLWRKRDAGVIAHFIEEMQDDTERRGAWDRYHAIRRLAESDECRPLQICRYFGETPKWSGCGHCDVCTGVPDWLSQPVKPLAVKRPEPSVVAVRSELIDHLRLWRRQQAASLGVPAYVVLHDTSLIELARRRPKNLEELRAVPGFGQKRVERYGPSILKALKELW